MKGPLNLATRAFRNERLAGVLFAAATFVLFLVTLQHAYLVYRFWPSRNQDVHEEVASLESEIGRLRSEAAQAEVLTRVSPAKLAEWRVIKDIVDRRTLWWSRLLSTFEELLPREMRVISISPMLKKEGIELDVSLATQGREIASGFVSLLVAHPEFDAVTLTNYDEEQTPGGQPRLRLLMGYRPPPAEMAPPPAPADPAANPTAAPEGDQSAEEAPPEGDGA